MIDKKGFTIFELIVVIAMISILMLVLYRPMSGQEATAKIQATVNYTQNLFDACQQWRLKTGNAGFSALSLASLNANGLWPVSMNKNPFGGGVILSPSVNDGSIPAVTLNCIPAKYAGDVQANLQRRGFSVTISNALGCSGTRLEVTF